MWITVDLQKTPPPRQISKSTIFVDFFKVEEETDARRQNTRVDFHPPPNAKISDPREFGGQDLRGSDYQTLPKIPLNNVLSLYIHIQLFCKHLSIQGRINNRSYVCQHVYVKTLMMWPILVLLRTKKMFPSMKILAIQKRGSFSFLINVKREKS